MIVLKCCIVAGSTSPPKTDRQRDTKDPMEALQAAASALFRRFNEAGALPFSAVQVCPLVTLPRIIYSDASYVQPHAI